MPAVELQTTTPSSNQTNSCQTSFDTSTDKKIRSLLLFQKEPVDLSKHQALENSISRWKWFNQLDPFSLWWKYGFSPYKFSILTSIFGISSYLAGQLYLSEAQNVWNPTLFNGTCPLNQNALASKYHQYIDFYQECNRDVGRCISLSALLFFPQFCNILYKAQTLSLQVSNTINSREDEVKELTQKFRELIKELADRSIEQRLLKAGDPATTLYQHLPCLLFLDLLLLGDSKLAYVTLFGNAKAEGEDSKGNKIGYDTSWIEKFSNLRKKILNSLDSQRDTYLKNLREELVKETKVSQESKEICEFLPARSAYFLQLLPPNNRKELHSMDQFVWP